MDDVTLWETYVRQAKELINQIHTNRMVVADLALKACLRQGGDRRSLDAESTQRSLKRFSAEIGLAYSTLWDWIQVKRYVNDKLPLCEVEYGLDYTAAKRTAY